MQAAETRAAELRASIESARIEHAHALVPGLRELSPETFTRWCVRCPDRWVDVSSLPRNARGEVLIEGQVVAIWKYVLAALEELGLFR
jgi:hypothetical protein